MCARYGLTLDEESVAAAFEIERIVGGHEPRWNIAPSQDAPVLAEDRRGRRMGPMRWGIPRPEDRGGGGWINARSETVGRTPAFRESFRRRRCLVPASGFYEWVDRDGKKLPRWVTVRSAGEGGPIAFAGIWSPLSDGRGGSRGGAFAILTTRANPAIAEIHERMPVILPRESWSRWIDPTSEADELGAALAPWPAEDTAVRAVSTWVNSARHEGPECLAPTDEEEGV